MQAPWTKGLLLFPFVVLPLAACGGSSPPASAPPSDGAETGVIRPITQAQLDVAHYSSADGVFGLVLDRTGKKPKLRVDGQTEVVELTMVEDRFAGERRGWYLVAPDGKRPVYISAHGDIRYYRGNDELSLNSDRKADPLPAATVTGTYVAPAPGYKATVDRLTAIAVRTKLPQFKPEDASNPSKVGDALALATSDMFQHYASHGATSWLPRLEVVPDAFQGTQFGGVARETDESWDPKATTGLARYGGKNRGFSEYDSKGNHMQVMTLAGYPPVLADGTAGLVWEVSGTHAVFVTLDGDRYNVELNAEKGATLDPGAGPSSAWPAPLQHALLDVPAVSSLVKAGALPKKAIDDLLALDDEWNKCAQKTWAGAQRAIDSNRFTEADRKDWVKKVEAACAAPVAKQERVLVQLIEARAKDRQGLFEKAKARVTAVGAAK